MTYKDRVVDGLLSRRLTTAGAVLLEGPKACGKTMTAERLSASTVRMDVDTDARRAAEIDPALVLPGGRPRLIDEWQLFPELWDHIRRAVDDAQRPGQFLLTGSSTPSDTARQHSGAGRIAVLRMRPMSLFEFGVSSAEVSLLQLFGGEPAAASGAGLELRDVFDHLVWGGWPGQLTSPDRQFVVDYLAQIANLDINAVPGTDTSPPQRGRDPNRVAACLASVARNVSTAAGVATLAEDAGLTRVSVNDYLAAMRRLMIVEEQRHFNVHLRSSRNLRTKPKLHFVDPSLATAALNADVDGLLSDLNFAGLLFESMVVRDLRVLSQPLDATVTYFTTDAHEIDITLQLPNGRWAAVEVKLGGEGPIDEGAERLLAAANSIDQTRIGPPAFLAVVTAIGRYAYRRDDGVNVIPLAALAP